MCYNSCEFCIPDRSARRNLPRCTPTINRHNSGSLGGILADRTCRSSWAIHSLAGRSLRTGLGVSSIAPLSTFNCRLSTSPSAKSFFHILAYPFALMKNSTRLFSGNSALFAQNTRGCGGVLVNAKSLFERREIPLSALRTGFRDFS